MTASQGGHSPNGQSAAPHSPGGAVVSPSLRPATVFPPDITGPGFDAFLYGFGRAQVLGVTIQRWCWLLAAASSFLWMVLDLAGPRWLALIPLVDVAAVTLVRFFRRRRDFVRFTAGETPEVDALTLAATEKLPVHISGPLSVTGKVRHFTFLPGFYRSFATREHGLLCCCRERRILRFAHWPEGEVGLWYAFFAPEQILHIAYGTVRYDDTVAPGLALEVSTQAFAPVQLRGASTTIYVACPSPEVALRILGDLRAGYALPSAHFATVEP